MAATRPLTPRDLDQAVAVFLDAFEIGETSLAAYLRARFSHILESDPQGAWVAVDGASHS